MAWTDEDRRRVSEANARIQNQRMQESVRRQRDTFERTQAAQHQQDHQRHMNILRRSGPQSGGYGNSTQFSSSPARRTGGTVGSAGTRTRSGGGLGKLILLGLLLFVGFAVFDHKHSPTYAPQNQTAPPDQPSLPAQPAAAPVQHPSPYLPLQAPAPSASTPPPSLDAAPSQTPGSAAPVAQENAPSTQTAPQATPVPAAPLLYSVQKTPPAYPQLALSNRIEGEVVLLVHVAPDGTVTSADPVNQASPILEAAAHSAVLSWRYNPSSGPSERRVRESIQFKLPE